MNFKLTTSSTEEDMTTNVAEIDTEISMLVKKDLRNNATPDELDALHSDPQMWRDELITLMASLDYQLSSLKLRVQRERSKAVLSDTLDKFNLEISGENPNSLGKKRVDILKLKNLAQARLMYVKRIPVPQNYDVDSSHVLLESLLTSDNESQTSN
jgi:hypothetical protein